MSEAVLCYKQSQPRRKVHLISLKSWSAFGNEAHKTPWDTENLLPSLPKAESTVPLSPVRAWYSDFKPQLLVPCYLNSSGQGWYHLTHLKWNDPLQKANDEFIIGNIGTENCSWRSVLTHSEIRYKQLTLSLIKVIIHYLNFTFPCLLGRILWEFLIEKYSWRNWDSDW